MAIKRGTSLSPYEEKIMAEYTRNARVEDIATKLRVTEGSVRFALTRARARMGNVDFNAAKRQRRPFGLSPGQLEVMLLLCQGYTVQHAADQLGICYTAAGQKAYYAMHKMGCVSMHQACFLLGQDDQFLQLVKRSA